MARSVTEIIQSMVSTLEGIDPSADWRKGPIYDLVIRPTATELAEAEATAEHLAKLYSLQFASAATDDEVDALATDLGTDRASGKPSRVRQTFFTFTRPDSSGQISVASGVLVGTTDNQIVYRVVENVTLDGQFADAFYNAAKRRYEITTTAEAVAVGSSSEVAAFRLRKLLTPVIGIDGTENATASTIGSADETKADLVARLKQKMLGFERGTAGGILSFLVNQDPINILAATYLSSADHEIFERAISEPAIDLYVIGSVLDTANQTFIADGGETEVVLESQPATSITKVSVNGLTQAYTFVEDTSGAGRGSANATSKIVFTTPLVATDVVIIDYEYNSLISDLQAVFDGLDAGQHTLFNTDTLVRTPVMVEIDVELEVAVLASFNTNRVLEQVEATVRTYAEPASFPEMLLPEVLRQQVLSEVAGVSKVVMKRFTKTHASLQAVEVIELNKHEQPVIATSTIVSLKK